MRHRRITLVALCVLAIVGCGWVLLRGNASEPAAEAGVSTCRLAALPPEVRDTVRVIGSGGPFPFPRSDGVVFGNREGLLPDQNRGYYHEYTVITPGASNRSKRRIVTGGAPLTKPPQFFYSGDHYASFCLITDTEGRS